MKHRLLASLLLSTVTLCAHGQDTSVKVEKVSFQSGYAFLTSYAIPNMPHVDKIVTAGQYAWAIKSTGYHDDSTITHLAYFDGKQWSNAINIAQANNDPDSLKVAYPTTGAAPQAWMMGEHHALVKLDGAQLTTYNTNELLGLEADYYGTTQFAVKGGYGYLLKLNSKKQIVFSIYNPTTNTWSAPKLLNETVTFYNEFEVDIRSDSIPDAYIATITNYNDASPITLYKITTDGNVTSEQIDKNALPTKQGLNLFATEQFLYLKNEYNQLLTYDFNQQRWLNLPSFGYDKSYNLSLNTNYEINGTLYGERQDTNRPTPLYTFYSLAVDQTNPAWRFNFNMNDKPTFLAVSTGLLFYYNNTTANPVIRYYDKNQNKLYDIPYEKQIFDLDVDNVTTIVSPVSDHQFVVCSSPNDGNVAPHLSFIDLSRPTHGMSRPDDPMNCTFSYSDTYTHQSTPQPIWIYNTATGYKNKKKIGK